MAAKLPSTETTFRGLVTLGDSDLSCLRAALHRHAVHHGKAQARSPDPHGWHAKMTERARNLMVLVSRAETVLIAVPDPATAPGNDP